MSNFTLRSCSELFSSGQNARRLDGRAHNIWQRQFRKTYFLPKQDLYGQPDRNNINLHVTCTERCLSHSHGHDTGVAQSDIKCNHASPYVLLDPKGWRLFWFKLPACSFSPWCARIHGEIPDTVWKLQLGFPHFMVFLKVDTGLYMKVLQHLRVVLDVFTLKVIRGIHLKQFVAG